MQKLCWLKFCVCVFYPHEDADYLYRKHTRTNPRERNKKKQKKGTDTAPKQMPDLIMSHKTKEKQVKGSKSHDTKGKKTVAYGKARGEIFK